MSKAFTRESDDTPEPRRRRSTGPSGAGEPIPITPDGYARLRAELADLVQCRRDADPASEGPGVPVLAEERIAELQRILALAVVVEPDPVGAGTVRFGSWIRVQDSAGGEADYRLVGAPEVDVDSGWISSGCPLARGLLGAREGDTVEVVLPAGRRLLRVISIR